MKRTQAKLSSLLLPTRNPPRCHAIQWCLHCTLCPLFMMFMKLIYHCFSFTGKRNRANRRRKWVVKSSNYRQKVVPKVPIRPSPFVPRLVVEGIFRWHKKLRAILNNWSCKKTLVSEVKSDQQSLPEKGTKLTMAIWLHNCIYHICKEKKVQVMSTLSTQKLNDALVFLQLHCS